MNLKLIDKVIASIIVVLLIVFCFLMIAIAWGLMPAVQVSTFVFAMLSSTLNKVIITLASLLMIYLCARVLFVRKKEMPTPVPVQKAPGIVVSDGEGSTLLVSLETVEHQVMKFLSKDANVALAKCAILPKDEGVAIGVLMSFYDDAIIPDVSRELSVGLKKTIEDKIGIQVKDIQMTIEPYKGSQVNIAKEAAKEPAASAAQVVPLEKPRVE